MKLNRFLRPRSKRANQQILQSAAVARPMACELLEDRKMLSLTIALRVGGIDGASSATVTSVGQVVRMEVVAIVTGNETGATDGFQELDGSFLSTETSPTKSVTGNLSSSVLPDYTANGAQEGNQVDLNGDGNLDVGSNNGGDAAGFFIARAGGIEQDGVVSGNTQEFAVGLVSYTVTSLKSGAATDLNFRLRDGIPSGAFDAVWLQDNVGENDQLASVSIGAPVVITEAGVVAPTGSISGTVTSKSASGSTSGLSGVVVYIDTNNVGAPVNGDPGTITASDGTYSLTGLAAGTYSVREVVPSGYTQTSPSTTPTTVTLTSNSQAVTGENFVDTAVVVAKTGSISGTVSGKSASGSTSGLSGVLVYIDTNNVGVPVSGDPGAITASNGTYSLTGLGAGTYSVREVVPSGYTQTSPSTTPTKVTLTSNSQAVTGENFVDTAVVVAKPGSIAGTVSKIVNNVTSAFAGVTVYLDNNNDGSFDSGDTSTTTSSTGTYSFTNLPSGVTYHLREVVPSGYSQTTPTTSPTNITLSSGQAVTGENFTDTAPVVTATGSISGTVYSDVNGNGKFDSGEAAFAGASLYIDLKKDGKDDSGDPTATTSSTGAYTFSGLAPGTYRVREVLASGDKFTNPTAGYFDVTVASGAKVTGENFGITGPLTLSGTVFSDTNSNGKQDSGEAGLSGWTVYVDLNKDGKFESSENNKTTASNGTYSFVSLKAGTYEIRVVPKTGYTLTAPSAGYYTVVLAPGLPVTGINFAEHAVTAKTGAGIGSTAVTLSGNVFNDANGNGVQDSTEAGLSGWVVYADLNNDGKFESNENNKTTDANGNFDFVSLTPGTYTIRVVPKAGYTETSPSSDFYTVTLAAGVPATVSFGEKA
jgi:protocatechuate 3,4-dioxygenase beta subunit